MWKSNAAVNFASISHSDIALCKFPFSVGLLYSLLSCLWIVKWNNEKVCKYSKGKCVLSDNIMWWREWWEYKQIFSVHPTHWSDFYQWIFNLWLALFSASWSYRHLETKTKVYKSFRSNLWSCNFTLCRLTVGWWRLDV